MKILNRHFMSAGVLAAALIVALPPVGVSNAADAAKPTIDTTTTGAKIATTEEARAARMMPSDPTPASGEKFMPASAATDGSLKPKASANDGSAPGSGTSSETIGASSVSAMEDTHPGPLGATGQTMPSLFSERNAILDRVPTMAMPLALTQQQRQQIYQTVMADKSRSPAADAESLAPASGLSANQALNEMQSLPQSLQDIEPLKGLRYVKAKDKVLLVTPSTRIVVDAITL
jgi:hypothetical protein